MWVRFISTKPLAADVPEKIAGYLNSKDIPTVTHFLNKTNGNAIIVLAVPSHVDQVLSQQVMKIPNIGVDKIEVASSRQLEILNAFELAIQGIDRHHGITELLVKFLMSTFVDDDGNPLLINYRVPDELGRNVFIFHMRDWESTNLVLSSPAYQSEFRSRFPALSPIELLFNTNGNGVYHKSIDHTLTKGVESVNSGFKTIEKRIEKVEKALTESNKLAN